MKNVIKNIGKWVKAHKWQTGVCAGAVVLAVGVGGLGIANATQSAKEANTKALLEMAEENGVVTVEDIENAGDLADLGTEIETKDGTVIITQDENGNIVTTLVKDKDGNSTGAVVSSSGDSESGGDSGGSSSGGDSPAGHTHNWIAHTTTRTVQTGTQYVVDVPAQAAVYTTVSHEMCASCHKEITSRQDLYNHRQNGCNGCTYSQCEKVLVTPAVAEQGHYEAVYGTETYVDYYYCECGATKS